MLRVIRMTQTANKPIAKIVCDSEDDLKAFDISKISSTSIAYICDSNIVRVVMLSPSGIWTLVSVVIQNADKKEWPIVGYGQVDYMILLS